MCILCVEYAAERMTRSEVWRALPEYVNAVGIEHGNEIALQLMGDEDEEQAEGEWRYTRVLPVSGDSSTTGGGTAEAAGELESLRRVRGGSAHGSGEVGSRQDDNELDSHYIRGTN